MRRFMAALLALGLLAACASREQPDPIQPPVLDASEAPRQETSTEEDTALFRFAVIGDFGTGLEEQYRVARRMCFWREIHPFDHVVTTGDNVYDTGDPDDFDSKFFRPYDCLFDSGVRWHAVLGNHDVGTDHGRPELEEPAFGMKGRNYVMRKNGVRFVMWDSTTSNRRWLRRRLAEEPGDRWTVVSFHHPVFTPGVHGPTPGYRPSLPRLFARKGVDLVINGHDHIYARMPLKRKVRYVVTGGGGAGLYDCVRPDRAQVCIERHHFLYVVARKGQLIVRAVPISGGPIDYFTTTGRP